jgi:hypothetical protein
VKAAPFITLSSPEDSYFDTMLTADTAVAGAPGSRLKSPAVLLEVAILAGSDHFVPSEHL